jgi:hypothetical protein
MQYVSNVLPLESTEEQFHATCLLLRSPASTMDMNAENILSRSVLRTGAAGGMYVETNSSCWLF